MIENAYELKKALTPLIREVVKQETRECLRVYRATVVATPYEEVLVGSVCQVKLIGDDTVLLLPYSSKLQNMQIGQIVLVATTYDSFQNAVVWDTPFFN